MFTNDFLIYRLSSWFKLQLYLVRKLVTKLLNIIQLCSLTQKLRSYYDNIY